MTGWQQGQICVIIIKISGSQSQCQTVLLILTQPILNEGNRYQVSSRFRTHPVYGYHLQFSSGTGIKCFKPQREDTNMICSKLRTISWCKESFVDRPSSRIRFLPVQAPEPWTRHTVVAPLLILYNNYKPNFLALGPGQAVTERHFCCILP